MFIIIRRDTEYDIDVGNANGRKAVIVINIPWINTDKETPDH